MSRARAARLIAVAAASLAILAAFAPSALAADGDGLWGPTNDKVVTYWSFGVLTHAPALAPVPPLGPARPPNPQLRRPQAHARRPPPAAD